MKLFGRDKNKDKDNEEKPIVFYYAKQIGVLGTNISLPIEEDAYVYLYEDRIDVKLLTGYLAKLEDIWMNLVCEILTTKILERDASMKERIEPILIKSIILNTLEIKERLR